MSNAPFPLFRPSLSPLLLPLLLLLLLFLPGPNAQALLLTQERNNAPSPATLTLAAQKDSAFAKLYDGTTLQERSLQEVLESIPKGALVFVGEEHNLAPLQQGQIELLKGLRSLGHRIHVAMEFLDYTQQKTVDLYREGALSEAEFLKDVAWGSFDFNHYRKQILFPNKEKGERTFAINSPRWLSSQVAKAGLASLSPEAKELLPPSFQMGRDSYRKRFTEAMADHVKSPVAMERYFEAQSLWDETMAWKLHELPISADETVVVIVGQFHTEFGGGLPYQLKLRGSQRPLITLQQYFFTEETMGSDYGSDNETDHEGKSKSNKKGCEIPFERLQPSPEYGPLGNILMIYCP